MEKIRTTVYLMPGTRKKLEDEREIQGITLSGIMTAAVNTYLRDVKKEREENGL